MRYINHAISSRRGLAAFLRMPRCFAARPRRLNGTKLMALCIPSKKNPRISIRGHCFKFAM